jgi:hypothetical protein
MFERSIFVPLRMLRPLLIVQKLRTEEQGTGKLPE